MLLTPEQVGEIREYHRHEGRACPGSGCAKCDVARLIRDRAEIAVENAELKKFAAGLELNLAAVIQRAEAAERELADAEALRALAAWIRNVRGNYVGLIATDGKLWRVDVCTCIRIDPKSGEGATLAAAIMDALGKANANRAA